MKMVDFAERVIFKLAWHKQTGAAEGENLQLVTEIDIPGFDPDGHAEDPRIILAPNKDIYITFVHATDDPKRPPCVRLARIRAGAPIDKAELLPLIEYEGNGTVGHPQKNWQFFFQGEKLFCVYWTYPHRVLEIDPEAGKVLNEWNTHDDKKFAWQWGPLSGGTPPVPWQGKMLSFYHGFMPHPIRRRRYYMGAYTFRAEAPFDILEISRPLLRGSMNDPTNFEPPNHAGLPLVVFPCGLLPEVGDPDQMLVSMGVNDSYCAIGTFDMRNIELQSVEEMRDPKTFYFFSPDISIPLRASQIRTLPWTVSPRGFGGVIATQNPMVIDDCITRGAVEISKDFHDTLMGDAEAGVETLVQQTPTGNSFVELATTIAHSVARLPGWSSPEKNIELAAVILALRPDVAVEIGVFGGRSLVSIGLAMKAVGKGIIHGIDPWSQQASVEGENESNKEYWGQLDHDTIFKTATAAVERFEISKHVELHRMRSDEFTPPQGIGLLIVDGNHASQAVKDVERYAPNVIVGGFVLMDDMEWTGGNVRMASEILQDKLGFRFVYRRDESAMFQKVK